MFRLKSGEKRARVAPQDAAIAAYLCVYSVYHAYDYSCIQTSGLEGQHGWSSEHFKGDAWDFRIRHVAEEDLQQIYKTIDIGLGPDFDVVLEKTHLHIEYDPKEPWS